jgi:hypothetical protein
VCIFNLGKTCFICADKQINYSTKCVECNKSICEVCFVKLSQTECFKVCVSCPFCNCINVKSFDELDSNLNVLLLDKMSVDLHNQKMKLVKTEKYYKTILNNMRSNVIQNTTSGMDYIIYIFKDFFTLEGRKVLKRQEFINYMFQLEGSDAERDEVQELILDDIQSLI